MYRMTPASSPPSWYTSTSTMPRAVLATPSHRCAYPRPGHAAIDQPHPSRFRRRKRTPRNGCACLVTPYSKDFECDPVIQSVIQFSNLNKLSISGRFDPTSAYLCFTTRIVILQGDLTGVSARTKPLDPISRVSSTTVQVVDAVGAVIIEFR